MRIFKSTLFKRLVVVLLAVSTAVVAAPRDPASDDVGKKEREILDVFEKYDSLDPRQVELVTEQLREVIKKVRWLPPNKRPYKNSKTLIVPSAQHRDPIAEFVYDILEPEATFHDGIGEYHIDGKKVASAIREGGDRGAEALAAVAFLYGWAHPQELQAAGTDPVTDLREKIEKLVDTLESKSSLNSDPKYTVFLRDVYGGVGRIVDMEQIDAQSFTPDRTKFDHVVAAVLDSTDENKLIKPLTWPKFAAKYAELRGKPVSDALKELIAEYYHLVPVGNAMTKIFMRLDSKSMKGVQKLLKLELERTR